MKQLQGTRDGAQVRGPVTQLFFQKNEVFLVFYRAYKHIISKDTSPTSGGSSPALNAPLLMRNINEYNII